MILVKPKNNKPVKVNQVVLRKALTAYSGTIQQLRSALTDLTQKYESGIEPVALTTIERIYLVTYKASVNVYPVRLITPKKIIDWVSEYNEPYLLNQRIERFNVAQEIDRTSLKEAIEGWDSVYGYIVNSTFVKRLIANVQNNKV